MPEPLSMHWMRSLVPRRLRFERAMSGLWNKLDVVVACSTIMAFAEPFGCRPCTLEPTIATNLEVLHDHRQVNDRKCQLWFVRENCLLSQIISTKRCSKNVLVSCISSLWFASNCSKSVMEKRMQHKSKWNKTGLHWTSPSFSLSNRQREAVLVYSSLIDDSSGIAMAKANMRLPAALRSVLVELPT